LVFPLQVAWQLDLLLDLLKEDRRGTSPLGRFRCMHLIYV
jgi:hypothetical protein